MLISSIASHGSQSILLSACDYCTKKMWPIVKEKRHTFMIMSANILYIDSKAFELARLAVRGPVRIEQTSMPSWSRRPPNMRLCVM